MTTSGSRRPLTAGAFVPFILIASLTACDAARNSTHTRAPPNWPPAPTADILVYGATAAGVTAAVAAARLGKTVIVLEPGTHIGGMTSGGLGATDKGVAATIGGLAHTFYDRLALHYSTPEAFQFEPHVAETILTDMLKESAVTVIRRARIVRVDKSGHTLTTVFTESGVAYSARVFIDATYEGDLMALADVTYAVGREANDTYGETTNGAGDTVRPDGLRLDPFVVPGDPESGLIPHISPGSAPEPGSADRHVQAYTFRLCLTDNPLNLAPIEPPARYDEAEFELLARYLEARMAAGLPVRFDQFVALGGLPNRKFDANSRGFLSTDFVGGSLLYPDADEVTRDAIRTQHERHIRSFFHFLRTSLRVPLQMRSVASSFGLCKDEFTDTHNWPHQLYVREARRMIGAYIMTENDVMRRALTPDPVGLGSYSIDSHHTQRLNIAGEVRIEGYVEKHVPAPYPVSYDALTPRLEEADNLLVPVCLSSSHAAYLTLRMEPVFMILGHSAGTAASLAIDEGVRVQDVDRSALRARLQTEGQLLEWW
jgi:hypothetical protein